MTTSKRTSEDSNLIAARDHGIRTHATITRETTKTTARYYGSKEPLQAENPDTSQCHTQARDPSKGYKYWRGHGKRRREARQRSEYKNMERRLDCRTYKCMNLTPLTATVTTGAKVRRSSTTRGYYDMTLITTQRQDSQKDARWGVYRYGHSKFICLTSYQNSCRGTWQKSKPKTTTTTQTYTLTDSYNTRNMTEFGVRGEKARHNTSVGIQTAMSHTDGAGRRNL
jgi:hypothetical protein